MTPFTPFASTLLLLTLTPAPPFPPPPSLDDCATLRARVTLLESELFQLRSELTAALDSRLAREQEFLRFTQEISALRSLATPTLPTFTPHIEDLRPKILDVPKDPAIEAASLRTIDNVTTSVPPPTYSARDHEVYVALRILLLAEQVTSLDLLETGQLHEDWVGPIVMRTLDDRGRPLGSIAADRLRLEASRAARMITLVLENGYERRGGQKLAFEGGPADADGRGGVRRIALPECDPKPWIDRVPELFGAADRDRDVDDGRYDLGLVRAGLNQLLKLEASSGWYRVQGLGGIQGNVMRDVALDRLDADGRVECRYFADRMTLLRETRGVQLSLEGGSQVRSNRKAPFLDGRCRIFFPRADVVVWEKAGLPGLAPVDAALPAAK